MRAAEIALQVFLGVTPFLMADDHGAVPPNLRETAGHGRVVAMQPIAVQLDEAGEGELDVILRKRARRMPRDLHPLPRREILVDGLLGRRDFLLHAPHFGVEIDILRARMTLQIGQLLLQLDDRLFKFQG